MQTLISYILMALMMVLTACSTTSAPMIHPSHWASIIKADANLYKVDDKLYRSEQPIVDDVAAIHAQNIKTVINLRYFDRNDDHQVFDDKEITLVNQPLLTWRIRPVEIAQVLYAIEREQQKGAVLVHCYHGADRTGIVVAMYRVIYQYWSIDEARQEMQQGNFGYHSVWKNLDRLLSDVGVLQVKSELERLRQASWNEQNTANQ